MKELTFERTRNIRAWLLPVILVCGPLVHVSPPREVSEIIERKGAHKRARNFIFTSSGSFLPPSVSLVDVLDHDPPCWGLAEDKGAGPTALQRCFLPTRQGRWPWGLLPGDATSISGGRVCAAQNGGARRAGVGQSLHGVVGEWMSWEAVRQRGVGSCTQGLSLAHMVAQHSYNLQNTAEAVSTADFHATTHTSSSEVRQFSGSND